MLREFLNDNRDGLIERCRFKVAMRRAPRATPRELSHGVPLFLDQLISILPEAGANTPPAGGPGVQDSAALHGRELLKHGFTIEQVVHDYGDLCQSITELAVEIVAPITVQEFGVLNITLDNAIASAVASFSAQHEFTYAQGGQIEARERLGLLANAMRNLLNTAILATSAMKRGNVGLGGATAAALDRSLIEMRGLIDRTLTEVRLATSAVDASEMIEIGPFIAAVQLAAVLEAATTECELTVMVEPEMYVRGDRHLLASAVANLLHGAVTSSERGGEVFLTARLRDGRVVIDIEDACTSVEPEDVRKMIALFMGGGPMASPQGRGLDTARRAIAANAGTLVAEAVPGKGCIYTISLPEAL